MSQAMRSTAIHEAAHFVIGWRGGLELDMEVSIIQNASTGVAGTVWGSQHELNFDDPQKVKAQTLSCLAGCVAEVHADPTRENEASEGARNDFEFVKELRAVEEIPYEWFEKTTSQVVKHWVEIKGLAEALLRYRRLDRRGAELFTEIAAGGELSGEAMSGLFRLEKRVEGSESPSDFFRRAFGIEMTDPFFA